ncbi:MAG: SDR family oxidoreductase [Polyangiaceae bacterium]|jgi:NAD(P)-dependent dehydrogenase (short-subunit alcohol dehydrogenase family)|nr:SDR family oxidoreductase [Polyangiaceae bacterium]
MPRQALVLGGSGVIGSEVVKALLQGGVIVDFTWLNNAPRARDLEALGARGHAIDLRQSGPLRALAARLSDEGRAPDLLIHCAAISRRASLGQLTEDDWDDAFHINVRSAFVACQALERSLRGGDVVLLSALDRGQSLPLPAHFAATQGALGGLAMALSRELGPAQVRVNVIALGPLEQGLSRELPPGALDDYLTFSALRRLGAPAEVARAIRWLALENRYLSGKVIPINGGI